MSEFWVKSMFSTSKYVLFFLLDQKETKNQASFLAPVLVVLRYLQVWVPAFAGMTNNGMCLWSCAPLFGVLSFSRRAKKTKFQDGTF
jgi:hypothetical protein